MKPDPYKQKQSRAYQAKKGSNNNSDKPKRKKPQLASNADRYEERQDDFDPKIDYALIKTNELLQELSANTLQNTNNVYDYFRFSDEKDDQISYDASVQSLFVVDFDKIEAELQNVSVSEIVGCDIESIDRVVEMPKISLNHQSGVKLNVSSSIKRIDDVKIVINKVIDKPLKPPENDDVDDCLEELLNLETKVPSAIASVQKVITPFNGDTKTKELEDWLDEIL